MSTQSEPVAQGGGVRWWRVLAGGLSIELLLIAVAVPFFATGQPEVVSIVIVPATLVVAVLCGAWVARGTGRPVLNGALAGVAALALYALVAVVSALAAPGQADLGAVLSPAYLASHLCKIVGGGVGGWLVARRRV